MTREIKFRAWYEDKIIEDITLESIADNYDCGYPCYAMELPDTYKNGFEKVIFMQFTGLLDKNGKEIYEGDIVKTKTSYPEIFPPRPIVFELGCFLVGPKGPPIGFLHEDSEVLGNIYENQNFIFIK